MSFLKFSRLRASSISSSFDKFSNLLHVRTIVDNNKLEEKGMNYEKLAATVKRCLHFGGRWVKLDLVIIIDHR